MASPACVFVKFACFDSTPKVEDFADRTCTASTARCKPAVCEIITACMVLADINIDYEILNRDCHRSLSKKGLILNIVMIGSS